MSAGILRGGVCYQFNSPYPAGTMNNWNFGDGTTLSTTNISATHCYTNVNTYGNINTTPLVKLMVSGQPELKVTLNHNNCQLGIFIGATDGTTLTNLTTYTVLPGSLFNGQSNTQEVYVYAPVLIDKDFTFQQTNIMMAASAGFDLWSSSLTIENHRNIGEKQGCPCLWRGIRLSGGSLYTRSNTSLNNALYAIAVRDKKILDVQQTSFTNNYIGMLGYGSNYNLDFTFSGNTFSSSGTLLNWCGGSTGMFDDPFLPSDGNYFTDRGWAGLCLIGTLTEAIGQNGPVNTFSNLANGIVLTNSGAGKIVGTSLTKGIVQCRFEQIKRGNYPLDIAGNGILFRDSRGTNFMRQAGLGKYNTLNPTFRECSTGIHGIFKTGASTRILSVQNRMIAMDRGYFTEGLGGTNRLDVLDNYIQSNQNFESGYGFKRAIGVEIFAQTTSTQVHVDYNDILFSHPDFPGSHGIHIRQALLAFPVSGQVTVSNNLATMQSDGFGIFVTNTGHPVMQENTIIQDIQTGRGIFEGGNDHSQIQCNDIQGPVPVPPYSLGIEYAGLYAGFATDAIIRENSVTNFESGVKFNWDCGTVDFGCNQIIGNNVIGLFYANGATTGPQIDKGNIWNCNSTIYEALNTDNINYINSQFKAEQGTDAFPDSWNPFAWFQPSNNPTPYCPEDCLSGFAGTPEEGVTSTDMAVAQEQISNFPALVNSAEKTLYRKLKRNPGLMENSPVLQNFVSSRENTLVGKFYEVSAGIAGLFEVPVATLSVLDSIMAEIRDNQAEMSTLDSLLKTHPGEPALGIYLQQYEDLEQQVSFAFDEISGILATLQQARAAQASSLLAENSSINATEIYDQNEKQVNDFYLSTICQYNVQPTPAQLSVLSAIAEQCPEEGGRPVLWASAMYGYFTSSNPGISACSLEERDNKFSESSPSENFKLYPNPAHDICYIAFPAPERGKTYAVRLLDIFGKTLSVYTLNYGECDIPLNTIPPGMYWVQLMDDRIPLGLKKLIKF